MSETADPADPADVPEPSADPTFRHVELTRIGQQRYKAANRRGGVLPIGSGDDPDFTPVEDAQVVELLRSFGPAGAAPVSAGQ